ncbi:MAG: hypothetical protein K2P93_03870 [Alphaproteobacteria bacterium]|nr:hypothetical protein [Alphaproteobacteria bacterium]
MNSHNAQLLTILRSTMMITLFCLSSTSLHAMEEDDIESNLPLILPRTEQSEDEEAVKLKKSIEIAQLQQQLFEEQRRVLAAQKELEDYKAKNLTHPSSQTSTKEDLGSALSGGRSREQVKHNIDTEFSRLGESFSNLLNKGKFKHDKRLKKQEKKKQKRVVSSPSLEPNSHPKRTSSLSQREEEALPHQQDVLLSFNTSFKTTSSEVIPQGYQFVVDPSQIRRNWGTVSILHDEGGQVKLTGDGYVFYYKLTKEEIVKFHDQELIFSADIKSNTPGAYMQYWDYPNPDKTQSSPNKGKGEWETLKLKFKVDASRQQFLLYPAILPAVEGTEAPEVEVKNVRLRHNAEISKTSVAVSP